MSTSYLTAQLDFNQPQIRYANAFIPIEENNTQQQQQQPHKHTAHNTNGMRLSLRFHSGVLRNTPKIWIYFCSPILNDKMSKITIICVMYTPLCCNPTNILNTRFFPQKNTIFDELSNFDGNNLFLMISFFFTKFSLIVPYFEYFFLFTRIFDCWQKLKYTKLLS